MKLRFLALFVLVVSAASIFGQARHRYAVTLCDKEGCGYSTDSPEEFLSERAIERRLRQGIDITEADLPLSSVYTDSLHRVGFSLICASKWTNTAVVECDTIGAEDWLASLGFVSEALYIGTYSTEPDMRCHVDNNYLKSHGQDSYGALSSQLAVTNTSWMHSQGYDGEGMLVAVIDDGFRNADSINAGWNGKIAGFRDVVNPDNDDIYNVGTGHGTMVLSCMAADVDSVIRGGAPGASYWLMRTELEDEQPVEMYYLAAAIECADSIGCDISTISLGYSKFDTPFPSLSYDDLDGSSLVSAVADMAVDRGMLVVVSAGNEGNKSWRYISVPSDGKNVLCIGALAWNSVTEIAAYSSVGPSSDGRTKPDVVTPGTAGVVTYAGELINNNGTSFAAPLATAGLACLWQAVPELSSHELVELVRGTATRADSPDNSFGYGIADFRKAYETSKGAVMSASVSGGMKFYGGVLHLSGSGMKQVDVYDVSGIRVFSKPCSSASLDLSHLGRGLYIVVVRGGNKVETLRIAI